MRLLLQVTVALVAIAGACSPAGLTVELGRREFVPATVTVAPGETITFVNESREAHTVTAYERSLPEGAPYFASGGFASEVEARAGLAKGLLRPGETFSVTVSDPGTFRYFCMPHEQEGMTGTIVVRP